MEIQDFTESETTRIHEEAVDIAEKIDKLLKATGSLPASTSITGVLYIVGAYVSSQTSLSQNDATSLVLRYVRRLLKKYHKLHELMKKHH